MQFTSIYLKFFVFRGFRVFFHKKHICMFDAVLMFFWEMHLYVTLAENESTCGSSAMPLDPTVNMQPLLEVSKQQIHWSTNFWNQELPLSTRESCANAAERKTCHRYIQHSNLLWGYCHRWHRSGRRVQRYLRTCLVQRHANQLTFSPKKKHIFPERDPK